MDRDTLGPTETPNFLPGTSHSVEGIDLVIYENGKYEQVPRSYLEDRLEQLGPEYYNSQEGAVCLLETVDLGESGDIASDGTNNIQQRDDGNHLSANAYQKEFWAHEEYLALKSTWFRDLFTRLQDGEQDPQCEHTSDGKLRIKLKLLRPDLTKFDEILYWMYTGNDQRWLLHGFTLENYEVVRYNVKLLGLDEKALAICTHYRNALAEYKKMCIERQEKFG